MYIVYGVTATMIALDAGIQVKLNGASETTGTHGINPKQCFPPIISQDPFALEVPSNGTLDASVWGNYAGSVCSCNSTLIILTSN